MNKKKVDEFIYKHTNPKALSTSLAEKPVLSTYKKPCLDAASRTFLPVVGSSGFEMSMMGRSIAVMLISCPLRLLFSSLDLETLCMTKKRSELAKSLSNLIIIDILSLSPAQMFGTVLI